MCDSTPHAPGLAQSMCLRNICWSKLDHFTASADIVSGTAACQFLWYASTLQILVDFTLTVPPLSCYQIMSLHGTTTCARTQPPFSYFCMDRVKLSQKTRETHIEIIHVHRVSDAIQPSHPLSSPSPPAPNPSQHQSLFQDFFFLPKLGKM